MKKASKFRLAAVMAAITVSVASGSGRVAGSDSAEDPNLSRLKAIRARISAAERTQAPTRDGGASFSPMSLVVTRSAPDVAIAMAQNPSLLT